MDNHYHLVIETPDPNLSTGMKMLNSMYTGRFNIRHKKVGHLLEEKVDLKEIPRRERYAARKSLSEIFGIEEVDNIDTVMEKAYKIYGYTLREIGDFPGVHYSTVSKRIKMMEVDT